MWLVLTISSGCNLINYSGLFLNRTSSVWFKGEGIDPCCAAVPRLCASWSSSVCSVSPQPCSTGAGTGRLSRWKPPQPPPYCRSPSQPLGASSQRASAWPEHTHTHTHGHVLVEVWNILSNENKLSLWSYIWFACLSHKARELGQSLPWGVCWSPSASPLQMRCH